MNTRKNHASIPNAITNKIITIISVALCALSVVILFIWHQPKVGGDNHNAIIAMSYNTAICVMLSGISLMALIRQHLLIMKGSAFIIGVISGLTLLDLLGGSNTHIQYWFMSNNLRSIIGGGLMSPITALCFLVSGSSLLLFNNAKKYFHLYIVFLNAIVLIFALISLLGHSIGLLPAFVWLGIKMALHTTIAISLFSIAIISYIYQPATHTFNQLNFFNRIAIGFGFIGILVIAIGGVAIIQIHVVSIKIHKLYEAPLQTYNALQRLDADINAINRTLKNIAIEPLKIDNNFYASEKLSIANSHIQDNLNFIKKNEPNLITDVNNLTKNIQLWHQHIAESIELLKQKEFEKFSYRVLHEEQEQAITFETVIERMRFKTQQEMESFNNLIVKDENESEKLVLVMLCSFLIIGFIISSLITRSLANQLQKIRTTMMAIKNEKLTEPIPFLDYPQEIGDMARALKKFQENLLARNELEKSRDRLELTTRLNQIGVWEFNATDDLLIWNDAMFEIYGRHQDYFTHNYQAWQQCVHPDDIEHTEKLFRESIEKHTPFICKFRIIQPDGTLKYLHSKATIEKINDNKIRILGTNIDISREEQILEKLHNLETLRSAIVESSEDAIISKTPTGIITSWNQGAYNMFGYSAEEAIGVSIKELVFPSNLLSEEDMLLAQVRAGLTINHYETIRHCKDGHLINVSISLSPIKDASGNIIGVSAIKRNITENIENAKSLAARKFELERANRELERSNKELETFAYVASHDLKSPLRGIAQLSTWIEEDISSNEFTSVLEHTSLLRNRIQRMEKLLDDLLIFYRAGKSEGSMITIDVNEMVTDIFEIQNNKPELQIVIRNALPIFNTLSTPFELIIRNLFSNAIKHHDQPKGIVEVSSKNINDDFYEFSVSDDGPGIPEKFQARIFGMFQTLKPRDELEGSGMGLALIKKIVEAYGGKVTLKSTGRGSCFSFSWPKSIYRKQDND